MSLKEQTFVISNDGSILTIYDDELLAMIDNGGDIKIARASHVEPFREEQSDSIGIFQVDWVADLAPVGGPKLGPYKTRGEALQAEFDWLGEHLPELNFPASEENDDARN